MPPSKLASHDKKINDFRKITTQFDPQGKLRNEFPEKNIYES